MATSRFLLLPPVCAAVLDKRLPKGCHVHQAPRARQWVLAPRDPDSTCLPSGSTECRPCPHHTPQCFGGGIAPQKSQILCFEALSNLRKVGRRTGLEKVCV